MNEQEIVSYLKENKNKGVIFALMPDEVKDWCRKRKHKPIFLMFEQESWTPFQTSIDCNNTCVYCLIKDYEIDEEFKPYWQEFDIDDDGYFYYNDDAFYYRDDIIFEKRFFDIFKGFGGWLYDNGKGRKFWTTFLHVVDENGLFTRVVEPDIDVRPVYPTKIRFWKYR